MNCDYGCNQLARFKMSNGKNCCESHYSKCPAIKMKNSNAIKKAHKKNPKMNSHIKAGKMNGWQQGGYNNSGNTYKYSNDQLFSKNFLSKVDIKERIIRENLIPYECKVCKINSWNNKEIILELHHKNGNEYDNRLENLEFLCPNCHSQTENFRGKNKHTGKKKVPDDILIEALKSEKNIRQALIKVGLAPKGANYHRAFKLSVYLETNKQDVTNSGKP